MTFREKLKQEHPRNVNNESGRCLGCPSGYGYESDKRAVRACLRLKWDCTACWDREIPGTEEGGESR